jgi:hypothetical protein
LQNKDVKDEKKEQNEKQEGKRLIQKEKEDLPSA